MLADLFSTDYLFLHMMLVITLSFIAGLLFAYFLWGAAATEVRAADASIAELRKEAAQLREKQRSLKSKHGYS